MSETAAGERGEDAELVLEADAGIEEARHAQRLDVAPATVGVEAIGVAIAAEEDKHIEACAEASVACSGEELRVMCGSIGDDAVGDIEHIEALEREIAGDACWAHSVVI